MTRVVHPDEIRTRFSTAMSAMYRREVPQYGELLELVAKVNEATLEVNPALAEQLESVGELARLDVERHGAIRLGTAAELSMIRRLFAVMGMQPVGYYDLSVAGMPVHSTAFRPVEADALRYNPFRVFCSLIRLELLEDATLAREAAAILARRQIVDPQCQALIERAESDGGLGEADAEEFVSTALETFRWHSEATVDAATYERLHDAHRLIADVVCFRGPHINHLTPRTLDIDAVQAAMPEQGMTPKAVVEGPPRRAVDILLRQTSFQALEEAVTFPDADAGGGTPGSHTARFGEIEQRGIALTPRGREHYDAMLANARERAAAGEDYVHALTEAFHELPDDAHALRRAGLAFFRYRAANTSAPLPDAADPDALIASGHLIAEPMTYEDFLPVSAAGIFRSNLGQHQRDGVAGGSNQPAFERALGRSVLDPMTLYSRAEAASLRSALTAIAGRA